MTSTTPSRFEAHAGLFRMLMKGIFDAYVLSPFGEKFISELVMHVRTRDSTVYVMFWLQLIITDSITCQSILKQGLLFECVSLSHYFFRERNNWAGHEEIKY